ncbi:MAG: LAGLIDADG family homing endonuclease [Patescibacteria group bacterium]
MRAKKLDNLKEWRDRMKAEGKIKSSYEPFEKNGDLAELIGVVLGDGHIYKHVRCESLRIVGSGNNPGFAQRYASLVENIFGKKPHVALRSAEYAINITIYQREIAARLGIPAGSRKNLVYELPPWIQDEPQHIIYFLRGLYEAEGCLAHHEGTYTHKFQFSNVNRSLLDIVFNELQKLGFHPHRSPKQIQVSRKEEVQKLANLLQFRNYGP